MLLQELRHEDCFELYLNNGEIQSRFRARREARTKSNIIKLFS